MSRPRVVIIGGGFGGLACAQRLAGRPVEVVLIDRRDYHEFSPLLYQVASALLTASDIAYPFRAAFRHVSNVRVLRDEATAVDLQRRVVEVRGRGEVAFDYLVLATGSENNYFGNAELARHTLSMKTLPQAQRLRNHVLASLERAAQDAGQAELPRWLTFVVIGGGPTGVEFTGALLELLKLVLGRDYPELDPELARVLLVEGTDRLLPTFPARLGAYARRVLEQRGVDVLTGTLVQRASAEGVLLANGREIPAATVVWSAGIHATQLPGTEHLSRTRAQRLITDTHLRIGGDPRTFAIGDLASVQLDGQELPMLSPPAMQEGRHVARVILADLGEGDSPPPFRYHDKGSMAVIGRNAAVGTIGRLQLTGALGWVAWLCVHIYYLIGFRNRAVVLVNWAWNYLRRDRPIRMITNIDRDPLADGLSPAPVETPAKDA